MKQISSNTCKIKKTKPLCEIDSVIKYINFCSFKFWYCQVWFLITKLPFPSAQIIKNFTDKFISAKTPLMYKKDQDEKDVK